MADPSKVPAKLALFDVPSIETTPVGRKKLITESDLDFGVVPMAFPSESSVLIAVLVAERSSLLGFGSEDTAELCVRVAMDDDVDPVIVSLTCVPLRAKEENRGCKDVLEVSGPAAFLDSGKTFAVERNGSEVTDVLGAELICGRETWLVLLFVIVLELDTVSRFGWEGAPDTDD